MYLIPLTHMGLIVHQTSSANARYLSNCNEVPRSLTQILALIHFADLEAFGKVYKGHFL